MKTIKSLGYTAIAIVAVAIILIIANPKDAPKQEAQTISQEALRAETANAQPVTVQRVTTEVQESETYLMTPEEFEVAGIIDWNGWRYTYYSEYVLPGEGLKIPGRHSDGQFVRDENEFLCVASNEHPYGSKVETPFGTAIVYDMIGDDVTGIIDIYVSFN